MFDQSAPGGLEQCLFAPMGQCPPCGNSMACVLLVFFPFDGFGHKSVTLSLKTLVFQNTPACSSCLPAPAQPSHVGPPLASGLVLASSSFRGRKMAARRPPETHQRILFGPHSVFCFFFFGFNLNAVRWGKHSPSSPQSPSIPVVLHPSVSPISITCLAPGAI